MNRPVDDGKRGCAIFAAALPGTVLAHRSPVRGGGDGRFACLEHL